MDTSKTNSTKPRRKTFIVPKRTFILRYPRATIWVGTTLGLLIFFSRPIYDAFFRTEFAPTPPPGKLREYTLKQWKV